MKVTTAIKNVLATQKQNEALGVERVRALLQAVRKEVVIELATTPLDSYLSYRLNQTLSVIDRQLADWETKTRSEMSGLISDSWQAGAEVLPAAASAAGMALGSFWLSSTTLDALKEFTFGRIANVRNDTYNRIKGELTLGILGQKTPQEITTAIAGELDSPSIFKTIGERAEVITGTEMGRAFSLATQKSIEAAKDTIPDLQSMWIHAGHPKQPRQIHLYLHGEVRKVGNAFYKTAEGIPVMFPRDPRAPIKEIIRCG